MRYCAAMSTESSASRRAAQGAIDRLIAEQRKIIKAAETEIGNLNQARSLVGGLAPRRQRQNGNGVEQSRRAAGDKAIEAVAEVLAKVGRTTQSEIARAVERNSGTVTHALRVLESEGRARPTGRKYRRSPEWASVAAGEESHAA